MVERLLSLMCTLRDTQADTPVLLLTNGRALCLPQIQAQLKELLDAHDRFGIPIHGSNAALHDAITQSPGSFAQTIAGLHFLADSPADIEIRIVCITAAKFGCPMTRFIRSLSREFSSFCRMALMSICTTFRSALCPSTLGR